MTFKRTVMCLVVTLLLAVSAMADDAKYDPGCSRPDDTCLQQDYGYQQQQQSCSGDYLVEDSNSIDSAVDRMEIDPADEQWQGCDRGSDYQNGDVWTDYENDRHSSDQIACPAAGKDNSCDYRDNKDPGRITEGESRRSYDAKEEMDEVIYNDTESMNLQSGRDRREESTHQRLSIECKGDDCQVVKIDESYRVG